MNIPGGSKNKHTIAILQALLVTFLWSTSFVIIKFGLVEIPPVIFAGMRYILAFFIFIPFIAKKKYLIEIKNLNHSQWKKLILLGLVFYTFTQGSQFLGLSLLPSVTVSLMQNFTPLIVVFLGIIFLNEKPNILQWCGSILFIIGACIYFFPISFTEGESYGILVMIIGVLANSFASIIGRNVNRGKNISPIVITFISMGIGAFFLLIIGLISDGFPSLSFKSWIYLFWLAGINTALAFTIWNLTLQSLTAMESSIINGTMLIQIAVLSWLFLDEPITSQEVLGMVIAAAGVIFVQLKRKNIKK